LRCFLEDFFEALDLREYFDFLKHFRDLREPFRDDLQEPFRDDLREPFLELFFSDFGAFRERLRFLELFFDAFFDLRLLLINIIINILLIFNKFNYFNIFSVFSNASIHVILPDFLTSSHDFPIALLTYFFNDLIASL